MNLKQQVIHHLVSPFPALFVIAFVTAWFLYVRMFLLRVTSLVAGLVRAGALFCLPGSHLVHANASLRTVGCRQALGISGALGVMWGNLATHLLLLSAPLPRCELYTGSSQEAVPST